ncbi:MAG: Calx-beta domain-containing protein [Bacteroidota bacterium]
MFVPQRTLYYLKKCKVLYFSLFTLLLTLQSQNLTAQTTITFDDQSYNQSDDVTSSIASGLSGFEFEYERGGLTQSAGIFYDEDNGFDEGSGKTGGIFPEFMAGQKIIISRTDGAAFDFVSFSAEGGFGFNSGIFIQGFNGVTSEGTQTELAFGAGTTRVVTLSSDFDNVTSVEITDNGGGFGFDAILDQFIFVTAASTPEVTLSATGSPIAENGGTSTLTATTDIAVSADEDITIAYSGSATNGVDYTGTTTITIPSGMTTGSITITGLDDTRDDDAETIIATITGTETVDIGTDDDETITITDDDAAPEISINDVTQNEGLAGTISFNFTVSLDRESNNTITVSAATADGTAIAGIDYTAIGSTITFSPGDVTETVTVSVQGETLDEADETFTVNLTSPSNATISDASGTGTITNDDDAFEPEITFSLQASGVDEGSDVYLIYELDAASGTTASFNLANVTGNSDDATLNTDYTLPATPISISAGDTKDSVRVSATSDALVEGPEQIRLQASGFTNLDGSGAGGINTFTLNDTDAATISIADVTTNEGASGSTTFTFTVTATTGAGVTIPGGFSVDYATSNGTAAAGSDYTAASGTLNFTGSSNETQTFTVTVAGDATVEVDETFTATLSNIVISGGRDVSFSDASATGTITNDDQATVTIADVAVDENNGTATITLSVDNAVDGGFDVDVSTSDGTATTADSDYSSVTNFTQTFAGTASETETFTVTLGGDTKVEADETVSISMSTLSPATVDAGDIDITDGATLTLNNDDQATVTIANVSGNEDDGGITVTATLDVAVDGGFDVDVSTTDGSATTADNDYTAVTNFTLTFAGTASEQETFTVTPTSDATVESDETVTISMGGLSPNTVAGGDIDVTDNATVTILNDDDVSFSVNDPSVSEGDAGSATLQFTVTLSAPAPAGGATVDYATSDGTASSASDYTAIGTTTLSFSAGQTTRTVDVTVAGDEIVEVDETITLTLSNPTGTDVVIGDATGSGTINNDDQANVTIADVAVNENSGTATITLSVDNAVDGGFSVDVSTSDGTATTADSDYSSVTNATETFAGTASETETLTVTLGGDTKVEADETITISMSNLSAGTVDGSDIDITDNGTLTLNNDDAATVTIANVAVNENSGTATITLTLDNAVDGGFSVDVSTTDGTATTADGDYSSVTAATETFAGTASETETLTVTLGGDTKVEGDETVTISMATLVPATVDGSDIDITDTGTLTLNNDDAATVTIADVAVDENNGTATITLTLDNAVDGGFSVDVSTADGTAETSDSDYTAVTNATETFAGTASETETLTITLGGDTKVEADETVAISMSNLMPSTVASGDIDISDGATLTLNNDDQANVTIADVAVNENSGTATITLSVDNAVDGGFSVDVSTSDGTATTADSDYSSVTNATETFAGTASETETLTVTLGGDTKVEADETITISMSNLSAGTVDGSDIDITDNGTLTLNNDDQATLTIDNESGNEDDGAVTFTVTLDNAVDGGFSVDVNTADGTATIANSDYTAVTSETLTFAGTASETETFTVTPSTDSDAEADETVSINMDNVTAGTVDVGDIDESDTAILTILNDDNVTASVDDPTVSEGDAGSATLTFTVTLSNPAPAGGATVDYATSDGTASSASDYTAIGTTTLSFSAGQTSRTVDVTVAGDETVEVDETITLTLSNPTGTDVVIGDATGSGTITNDDVATVTVADISPNENGTFTLSLISDNAVDGGFSLGVTTADGTATAGDDYTALVSEAVTFAGTANETEQVTITVSDDNVVEADETITISLDSKAAGTVDTGDIDITDGATATITNDDQATLTIENESGNEDDGAVTFTVTVDNAVDGGFTVDVNTADGTATIANSDYTAVSGSTLSFAGTAGESETFDVTPTADVVGENNETVNISMDNVTAVTVDAGDIDESDLATLTIVNDDDIELSVNDPSVTEGDAGSVTLSFTVSLSAPAPTGGATVDYATSDGTAEAGTDYTAASGTVSFLAGETSQTVNVTVSGDEIVERDETITFTLSNATGTAVVITDATGTGTITNDDQASLTHVVVLVDEDDGSVEMTVRLDNAVDGGFSVDLSTFGGTATAGDDYTAVSLQTISFDGTAGEEETVTLTIATDDVVERNETVGFITTNKSVNLVDPDDVDVTGTGTVQITNDDQAIVTVADVSVLEGDGTARVVLTLSGEVDGGFDVDVSTNDNTAQVADADYAAQVSASETFTGTDGETQSLDITIGTDGKVEADELIDIILSNVVAGTVDASDIDITDGAMVTIVNDDQASVTIADVTVNEADGTATLTLTLDTEVEGGFNVDVSTADNTATLADNDYTAVSSNTESFTGTAGETQTFDVAITDDNKVESDELIDIAMSNLTATTVDPADIFITDEATVTINNDDNAAVTIADVSGNENDGDITVTAVLDNAVQDGFTVEINSADGTATTADSDYTALSGEVLTFTGTAGEMQTFTLSPTADMKLETDENLTLSMANLGATSLIVDITDDATVTINNDDNASITIADISGNENDGNITVTATLDNAVQGSFSVDVSTADGTAMIADADYASITSQSLNFAGTAGETQSYNITIGADTKVEADETLSISQSNLTGSTLPIDITDGATVTIVNDDQATVTINSLVVNENVGFATVMVGVDAAVDGGFSVDATFSDNTATAADNDYDDTSTTETETFTGTAGEMQSFDILINEDSKVEADELINLALSNLVPTTVDATDIDVTSTGTVTITNNDNAAITVADVVVNEDAGTATLTFTLDNEVQDGLTVDVNTADGTATTADADYTALAPETVTFAGTAGETETVDVTIGVDSKLEPDETFTVSMNNTVPGSADAADIDVTDGATVTITNDDNAEVTIADLSANEDDGAITVTATLDSEVQGGFTVDVIVADGSATTADNDYTASATQTLTFAGTVGETQTISIAPQADSKVENDETITVSQSNLAGTAVNVVITDGATVTILNDDNAAVTIADVTSAEDDGAITLTATLDNPVDGGFTVEVNSADGTATTADSDYTAVSGQVLTFAGTTGETQTFTVVPTTDGVEENDEDLTVSMSSLGATSFPVDISDGATVTITNDDSTPVITASQSFIIDENLADGMSVGTVLATDADAATTFQSWTILSGNTDVDGDLNGAFAINATTGEITVNDSGDLDFESGTTSYTLTLTVSDGDNTSAEETVSITVEDVNDILPVVTAGQSFTIDENLANMTALGTLNATDADVTATTFGMWMITAGNDEGIFAIDASSGEITIADNSSLDRESFENILLTVTVSDGVNSSTPETVQININDLNDVLPVVTASQVFEINENAANDTSLGSVLATDTDVTATTFSDWTIVSGNTDNIFAINAASGEITVADNTNLDFESTSVYTLVVTVSDGSNTSAEENVTINVTDDNEVPVITGLADFSFDEDTEGTTAFAVSDPDTDLADLQFTFAVDNDIVFMAGGATVSGDGSDRTLTIVPNDDQFGTTELTVTVSDGELSSDVTITVVVNPVNDVPISLTLSNQTIDEDVSVGFEIGTFTTDDIDVADTHSYTLVSGNGDTDNAVFTINGDALELAEMVDFEEGDTRSIRVRTTDSAGDFIEETFTITLIANPDLELVIKTAFTPNGDGVNDTWIIDNITLHPNSRVTILNREGNTVFESVGYQTPWDGTFEGKELPVDTYYYVIDLETGGRRYEGFVMILK